VGFHQRAVRLEAHATKEDEEGYIYTYSKRERERERDRENGGTITQQHYQLLFSNQPTT